jgi:hypothetical protein
MEFRLGSDQRVCGKGDVVVIPGGMEHEAWFREETEVIDFFAPPRARVSIVTSTFERFVCIMLYDRIAPPRASTG